MLKFGSTNNQDERRETLKSQFPKNYNPLKKNERLNFNTEIQIIPHDRQEEREIIREDVKLYERSDEMQKYFIRIDNDLIICQNQH